jgi:hypothetical protein
MLFAVAWPRRVRAQAASADARIPARVGAAGALAAFLTHSLADFNLYIPANALTLSCILALACSVSGPAEERSSL